MNVKTEIWIDGRHDEGVTVDYAVTDVDQAAALLGYADYEDLLSEFGNDGSPLNFRYTIGE